MKKSRRKLDEIDFEPRSPARMLLIFAFLYGLGVGSLLLSVGIKLINGGAPWWINLLRISFLIVGYLLAAAFILFYGILGPRRFKFQEDGIKVLTWKGWQFFNWKEVKEAFLTDLRGNVDLVLYTNKRRYIVIPLNSFKRSETLFKEIVQKTDLYIDASARCMAKIREIG